MERSVYRIIDANYNRAREAIRVMEEFCRFTLNSDALTGRAKQFRHQLCNSVNELDTGKLIAARDTLGDVGVGKSVEQQLQRTNLKDCLTAASKRLTEALRVLSELTQTFNPRLAETLENLRYTAYTLEKDILLQSDTSAKFNKVKLYVIISSSLPAEVLSLTSKCIAGGADCIQLRAKAGNDDTLFALALEFAKICRDAGIISIINDRADIAVAAGADGVHLGQHDLPLEQVRKIQLTPLITGKSTHSLDQLKAAIENNPTYVALGPVFATQTKPSAEAVGLEYVKKATELLTDTGIASVAIGGINSENIEKVLKAGATKIAVCSTVTQSKNPRQACQILKEKINSFKSSQA